MEGSEHGLKAVLARDGSDGEVLEEEAKRKGEAKVLAVNISATTHVVQQWYAPRTNKILDPQLTRRGPNGGACRVHDPVAQDASGAAVADSDGDGREHRPIPAVMMMVMLGVRRIDPLLFD